MGKHKHRRRDRGVEYVQPMNDGYNDMGISMNQGQMSGNNQYMGNMQNGMNMNQQMNPNMNQQMNANMNMNQNMNMMNNPLLGLLGGLSGGLGGASANANANGMPDMNGLMQLLNGFGLGIDPAMSNLFSGSMGSNGGGNAGGMDIMQMLSGMGGNAGGMDIMQMLSSLLGGNMGGAPTDTTQGYNQNTQATSQVGAYDAILNQINPEEMRMIEGILQSLGIVNSRDESPSKDTVERREESLEDILANLDFNSILNNFSNDSFEGLDFNNVSGDAVEDINFDDVLNNNGFNNSDVSEIRDADIVEENILNAEKELTQEEYKKLINVLIKLIDPNKIRLLQKVFDEYEKRVKNK